MGLGPYPYNLAKKHQFKNSVSEEKIEEISVISCPMSIFALWIQGSINYFYKSLTIKHLRWIIELKEFCLNVLSFFRNEIQWMIFRTQKGNSPLCQKLF